MLKIKLHIIVVIVTSVIIGKAQTGFYDNWFLLSSGMYGPYGYQYGEVQSNFQNNMCNSFSFNLPFDSGMKQVIIDKNVGLFVDCFGSPHHSNGITNSQIQTLKQSIADFTLNRGAEGYKIWWDPMPEWDQGGGGWVPTGRPNYSLLSRKQAYQKFIDYYNNTCEFTSFGLTPADRGGCKIACVTDIPCNTAAAYEMGVDMVMIERTIDELSDISTGIPFVRGISRQYDKPWGVDISTWRTSNNSATDFNVDGTLKGGWSPSYLKRISYVSYMSGANVIQHEPSIYYDGSGNLNPLGSMLKEFGDFCLSRHPKVGRTDVTTAFMLDFYNGFDPKHWIWNQSDNVWYQDIPYNDGDFMINNFLKSAWPGHNQHGLCPGAPFSDSFGVPNEVGFQTYLSAGGDPRLYEPMCPAKWGSNFDIIYDNAAVTTLQQYKTIILVGDVVVTPSLKTNLELFVNNGGTLVVNSKQVSNADSMLLGVTFNGNTSTSIQSKWISDNIIFNEPTFSYAKISATSANVIADNNAGDALITSNNYGNGKVIFCAPDYLQPIAKDTLINVAQKLISSIVDSSAKATVVGPFMVDHIINLDSGKIIVTVINNTANDWSGIVSFNKPTGAYTTEEWMKDVPIVSSLNNNKIDVPVTVPAFDLKIFTLNYTNSTSSIVQKSPIQDQIKLTAYPNPGTKNIMISFNVNEQYDDITLSVFDLAGKKIKNLFSGKPTHIGENIFIWDGTDDALNNLTGGIYIVRLSSQHYQSWGKINLIK